LNVDDKEEPVVPHPKQGRTLVRLFELYATGQYTLEGLADKLSGEGHAFRPSQPRFNRTSLSYILSNRFYVGELIRNGRVYPGKYRLLVDRRTFDACQEILKSKNRRTGNPEIMLSGGVLRCAVCGHAITGEQIRRKLASGGRNVHVYYKCGNNHPPSGHPKVRWREQEVEADLLAQLGKIALDTKDYRAALDYSNRALNCNEMHVRAALQAAEAHHIFAREHLQPVPEAIKKLTAALADPATRKLKEQRRKLLRKEQLSDKEKEEFRRLTQQVWWAREQQYAILTRCCEYAGGDLGRKPAGMGSAGPVFSAFYSALSGVHFADVELGSGASVLQRILAIERMHPLLFKTAAAVYTEYANIWTLGGRAQQLLAKEMTALHEDLKADRVRLVDKKRENGLTKEEKKTFDDLTAQTNLLVGALIRLQTQLDRARHHSRRYAELADEHRQAYLDLTAAGD